MIDAAVASRPAPHPSFRAAEAGKPCLQDLFGRQPVETFDAGTAVFWEGDAADDVFEVVGGVLRVFKILADGRRIITGFIYPGDILGVSHREHYLYTAEAVNEVRLRRFARSRFRDRIDESAELRPQLFARLCDEMASAQDQMVLLARKNAEERVCSLLLLLARKLARSRESKPVIPLPMTRLDMADYLGLTIETVSRIMARLTARGVIAATGRHAVTINRTSLLARLAGEDCGDNDAMRGTVTAHQAVWPN